MFSGLFAWWLDLFLLTLPEFLDPGGPPPGWPWW